MTIQIPQDKIRPNIVLYAMNRMAPITLDIGAYTNFTILDSNGTTVYTVDNGIDFWKYLQTNY